MNDIITINNISIHQDRHGRYSLNDLHKADGGFEKHSPNRWTRTSTYKELVKALTPKMAFQPAIVIKGGKHQGTYVCKELVYAYAMWISPEFHVTVIRTFDAVITGKLEWKQARQLGKITRRDLTDTIQAFERYARLQGSQNADKYYMVITKMEYPALELVKSESGQAFRDTFNVLQQHQLAVMEHAARQAIREGMLEGLSCKDIYKKAKDSCLALANPLLKYTKNATVRQQFRSGVANA